MSDAAAGTPIPSAEPSDPLASEQVRRSVYERMRAERERLSRRFRSEGEEEARKIRAEADREESRILSEAYKKADILKG